MPVDPPRVVIVRGGFGGLYAARTLAEMSRFALSREPLEFLITQHRASSRISTARTLQRSFGVAGIRASGGYALNDAYQKLLIDWLVSKFGPDTKPFPRTYVPPDITTFFSDPDAIIFPPAEGDQLPSVDQYRRGLLHRERLGQPAESTAKTGAFGSSRSRRAGRTAFFPPSAAWESMSRKRRATS